MEASTKDEAIAESYRIGDPSEVSVVRELVAKVKPQHKGGNEE